MLWFRTASPFFATDCKRRSEIFTEDQVRQPETKTRLELMSRESGKSVGKVIDSLAAIKWPEAF